MLGASPSTLTVRRSFVLLPLPWAFRDGPSLPRGFPGGPTEEDGAASTFRGLVLATEGVLGSSDARACGTGSWAGAERCFIYLNAVPDKDTILFLIDVDFMHAIYWFTAMAELGSCLPGSSVAADATRLSAGCWEGTMNLDFGRPVRSTVSGVSPFIGPDERV